MSAAITSRFGSQNTRSKDKSFHRKQESIFNVINNSNILSASSKAKLVLWSYRKIPLIQQQPQSNIKLNIELNLIYNQDLIPALF
jgi:hypothetical protein